MGHTQMCQRAFPKPDDFDGSREAYAKSDAQQAILAWRNCSLDAAKEAQILHLCDRMDAYRFAMSRGVSGPDWDETRTVINVMADKFNARQWVADQMGATQ